MPGVDFAPRLAQNEPHFAGRAGPIDTTSANGRRRWQNLPTWSGRCHRFHITVEPPRIGIINAILEGYDGLCYLRTLDTRRGILEAKVTDSRSDEFRELAQAMQRNHGIAWHEVPDTESQT